MPRKQKEYGVSRDESLAFSPASDGVMEEIQVIAGNMIGVQKKD